MAARTPDLPGVMGMGGGALQLQRDLITQLIDQETEVENWRHSKSQIRKVIGLEIGPTPLES